MATMALRWSRVRNGLSAREWRQMGAIVGAIVALHLIGWGIFVLAV
ncbi:MAG: HoxN/HupN/NixA family nickel/cobalt transporter, partial [Candidatus Dormibacteraeota bacterium]|nr:HoxN/HupN/NixA family nickel/cobalt transporter [Candidatus Dormibacteraeota bacterium]